jgi:hypothetical protein
VAEEHLNVALKLVGQIPSGSHVNKLYSPPRGQLFRGITCRKCCVFVCCETDYKKLICSVEKEEMGHVVTEEEIQEWSNP